MNPARSFRKNGVTKVLINLFPVAALLTSNGAEAKIVIGEEEEYSNPYHIVAKGTDPALEITSAGIHSITNKGALKSENADALQININNQGTPMVMLDNIGEITSKTTAINVIASKDLTIVNSGVISGEGSSIKFASAGNNALVLKSGSVLTGDVTSTNSQNNTIALNDSGNETVNFVGVNKGVDGFKSLTMDGQEWTLSGDVDLIGTSADSLYVKTGKLILAGNVASKGATQIDSGATLQLGVGSGNNAALEGNIANNGTLIFNQAADYTFASELSGTGEVVKEGNNSLTLSGNNSYSGNTLLKAGTTLVTSTGTLGATGSTATVTIGSGATLASDGVVNSNIVIENGGTLAAWNAISANTPANNGVATYVGSTGNTINGNATNQGTLQIAGANNAVGNNFIINGDYTGEQGSQIVMNTVAADDSSATDHLAITGNSTGSSSLRLSNIGGQGAQTINGIELISVDGTSDALFTLNAPVVAGAWEYNLNQHADGNWYLESSQSVSPDSPEIYRPETGVYLANYIAAQQMFQHKRDDRDQLMLRDENDFNTWMYVKSQYTEGRAAHRNIDFDTTTSSVLFGSDFLSGALPVGALRSGFMLGAGHSDTNSHANNNPRSSSGNVNGYTAGLYATWLQDEEQRTGGYVDTWVAHNWFKNQIIGKELPDEKYYSKGIAASVEAGYALLAASAVDRTFRFEPQAQVIYNNFDQNNHTEVNGTRVTTTSNDSFTTRLGMRMGYVDQKNVEAWQPFLGAHWLAGNSQSNLKFNDETINAYLPENRYQGEMGVTGNLNDNTTISLRAVGEWGKNSWSAYSGHVLVNHRWK